MFLDRLGGAEVKVVMEATGFYEFIYDVIESRGVDVVLAHPLKLKALTAGRAKNDRNDAEMLAELLRIDAVPTSYVPPKDVRALRELTRHRTSLVVESTTLKNKIHAELARRGTRPPTEIRSPFTKKHVSWLRSLRRASIDDLMDILSIIQEKIERVDEEIGNVAKNDQDVQLLETIPGVGHVIATSIKAEVGHLGRFDSSDGLASYAGVAPTTRQSGEKKAVSGRMSKQGNPRLRYMLTEAVHIHVQFCKDSRITSYYLRKKDEKGTKKAKVAAAKKLLEVMYLMIVRRQAYQAH